jgi:hypothetical protein
MQAMTTVQGNLNALAKELEKSQQKVDKLQVKGEKADANKVANATSDVDNARVQWQSQAPYVFENLQTLDEARCNQLRDLLTQLQTLEADQIQKSSTAPEQCLNVLLNVETQDEIQTFVLRALSMGPSSGSTSTNQRNSYMPPAASTPNRMGSSISGTPSRDRNDDAASQVSESQEPKKGPLKGLRRFGTVMSRRRESKMPATLPSTAESPEKQKKSSPFGRLGRNKDSYTLEPSQEENYSQRPRSPQRLGSEAFEAQENRQGIVRSSSGAPQLGPIPQLNGGSSINTTQSPIATSYPNGIHQGDLADLQPPQQSYQQPSPHLFQQQQAQPYQQQPQPSQQQPAAPAAITQRDNEGFSVPPSSLDPISQAQADAAAEAAQPQYNVNIRDAPIQEEGGEAALASVATKLVSAVMSYRKSALTKVNSKHRQQSAPVVLEQFVVVVMPAIVLRSQASPALPARRPNNSPACFHKQRNVLRRLKG